MKKKKDHPISGEKKSKRTKKDEGTNESGLSNSNMESQNKKKENYPGYPDGVQGPEMMVEFEKQATRMGADIRFGLATKVDFSKRPYQVWIDEEKLMLADTVIIATGASAKWLGLESEKRLNGSGVSACAVCDGFFYRGKPVVVVGGGNTAVEDSMFLTRFASKVTLIHRREEFRASKIMLDRARANPKIAFLTDTVVDEVLDVVGEAGRLRCHRVEQVAAVDDQRRHHRGPHLWRRERPQLCLAARLQSGAARGSARGSLAASQPPRA